MKNFLTFALIFFSTSLFAQKVLFKDNLFNKANKSVEVLDMGKYKLLKFEDSDTSIVYNWKYEVVKDAIEKHYDVSEFSYEEKILEAGRVFYEVQATKILEGSNNYVSVAGVMGFESKSIFLQAVNFNIRKEYKKNLNEALRLYKNQKEEEKPEKRYKQFTVKDNGNIIDTGLEIEPHSKRYLKKYGAKSAEENFNTNAIKAYLHILDSLVSRNMDLSKSIESTKTDKNNSDKLNNLKNELDQNIKSIGETITKNKGVKEIILSDNNKDILQMTIDSIQVEITQTVIENMLVFGTVKYFNFQENNQIEKLQSKVTLRNTYPIGISTLNSIDFYNKRDSKLFTVINKNKYGVSLFDVLSFYRPNVKNYRRDYSPADTTFVLIKDDQLQNVTLFRTPSQKLFEFRVFSDFIGLDGTSPNGLVQTEFSKEMYLNPYRNLFCKKQNASPYLGWFSYITPNITISKLEKSNKYFELEKFNDSAFITTLNLKQYETYSVGADLNLLMVSVPFLKSNFYLDPGFAFGRTGVADSIYTNKDTVETLNERGINTLSFKTTVRIVFQTDEQYFFELRGYWNYLKLMDDNIYLVASLKDRDGPFNFWEKSIYSAELFAGTSILGDTKGKLFFRYRYTGSAAKSIRAGFSQIQLGYSYYFSR